MLGWLVASCLLAFLFDAACLLACVCVCVCLLVFVCCDCLVLFSTGCLNSVYCSLLVYSCLFVCLCICLFVFLLLLVGWLLSLSVACLLADWLVVFAFLIASLFVPLCEGACGCACACACMSEGQVGCVRGGPPCWNTNLKTIGLPCLVKHRVCQLSLPAVSPSLSFPFDS